MLTLAILATALMTTPAPRGQQATPAPSDAQRERAKEIYLPSAPHRELGRLAGSWEQQVEYAVGDGTVLRAAGRVENRAVLGGRFVVSEGVARQSGGPLEVESIFLFGFDGRSREYTVILLDSFGTYYVTAAAASTDSARVVMKGETPEHGGTKKFDIVLRWIDADTYRTEIIFNFPGRAPHLAVASTYRRVATAASAGR